jgi:hypothetical protein
MMHLKPGAVRDLVQLDGEAPAEPFFLVGAQSLGRSLTLHSGKTFRP